MEISGSLCLPLTSGFLFTLYIPVTDNRLKEEPGARDIYDSKTLFLKTFIKFGIWESFYGKSGSRILRSRVYNLRIIRFNRHPDVSNSDSQRRRHIDHKRDSCGWGEWCHTHPHTHTLLPNFMLSWPTFSWMGRLLWGGKKREVPVFWHRKS